MKRRTILQKGEEGASLYLLCHVDACSFATLASVPNDAAVVEYWGEGTSAYRPVIERCGSFDAWIADLAEVCEKDAFSRVVLTTFSAGSQVAKEVCRSAFEATGEAIDPADPPNDVDLPDAIVMLDGLYADKPEGSQRSDGQVLFDPGLEAIASYAVLAARGGRTLVILHSSIPTPYASSGECARAVRARVEEAIGAPLEPDPRASAEALGPFTSAVGLGGLHIVEFPGNTGAEHAREGQLYGAAWRLFLPWARA